MTREHTRAGRSVRTLSIEHKSQDLLVKLKSKREMHGQWKQGQVSQEEYRDAAWLCRDGVRKAKVQLELNLARDAKNS